MGGEEDDWFLDSKKNDMLAGGGGGSGGGGDDGDGESFGERQWVLGRSPHQMNASSVGQAAGTSGGEGRLLQWSHQETGDLIAIRADLERDSTVARGKRTLWEAVAAGMRERGYSRTPDHCKCKWKNLLNRYKGKETADPEIGRQCPFFEELNAVFAEREKNMQRLLLESESGTSRSEENKLKRPRPDDFNDAEEEEDDDDDDDIGQDEDCYEEEEEQQQYPAKSRKKRIQKKGDGREGSIQKLLQEFLQQQVRMELQWSELMERKAQERRMLEEEWRGSMQKRKRERLMQEDALREVEEQRRMREENRAEMRDAALTALLNRLIQDDT